MGREGLLVPKAIRGLLLNPKSLLLLKFQFNPSEITWTKGTNYELIDVPGWDHPDVIWTSGGAARVKFDLYFDASASVKNTPYEPVSMALTGSSIPLVGTDGIKAVIESFLYPEMEPLSLTTPDRFTSPPEGLLVLGTRFFRVIVEGDGDLKEVLFDKVLTPLRMSIPMSFIILESGVINDYNVGKRKVMSFAQSLMGAAEVITETLGMVSGLGAGPM